MASRAVNICLDSSALDCTHLTEEYPPELTQPFILFPPGDGDYKPYVSSEPDVTTVELNGTEDFLVIGCDGLWDTVTPQEAADSVYQQLRENKGMRMQEKKSCSSFLLRGERLDS